MLCMHTKELKLNSMTGSDFPPLSPAPNTDCKFDIWNQILSQRVGSEKVLLLCGCAVCT